VAGSYRVRIPASLDEVIKRLHPRLKRKIRAGLDAVRDDPSLGNELRDELDGLRSLRVSRFRIIYRVEERHMIELVTIGPRRTVYEEAIRLIRRERRP
jgi:mRNA interferase RelE/StbE